MGFDAFTCSVPTFLDLSVIDYGSCFTACVHFLYIEASLFATRPRLPRIQCTSATIKIDPDLFPWTFKASFNRSRMAWVARAWFELAVTSRVFFRINWSGPSVGATNGSCRTVRLHSNYILVHHQRFYINCTSLPYMLTTL